MEKIAKIVISAIALMAVISVPAMAQRGAIPISQFNMDTVAHLDRDGVRTVQQLLRQRGFDPGPLDGVDGQLTNAAIRSFQTRYGIAPAGEITNQTLFALGAVQLAIPGN